MRPFIKPCVLVSTLAGLALSSTAVMAELALPFVADEYTLHLWRFNNTNLVNNYYITPDEGVSSTPLVLTNLGLPSGAPPFTNIFNAAPVPAPPAPTDNCLLILAGGGAAGKAYALAAGQGGVPNTALVNPETGAFTFEALVCPMGALFQSGLNWQIFCGDNNGTRGWHWRIQTGPTPQMNFNFINPGIGNFVVNLPMSGPNAVATNQWYHAAVVYTGHNPTNGDPPGMLIFYWTLLDTNKESAAPLATNYVSTLDTIGNGTSPAVGGSQRTINGVGNSEGFVGMIDEVRVSMVARRADEMAFRPSAVINPPLILQEPPTNVLVAYGKQLLVTVIVSGSEPLSYQWQYSSNGAQFSPYAGQTNNSLLISPVNFGHEGYWRLVASNPAGSITSAVVSVTVGAAFAELYHTGVDANGFCDTNMAGTADLHYTLHISSDMANPGPGAIVWNMYGFPIAMVGGGGMFANPDGISQWIGPRLNPYTSPQGKYVYRTRFVTEGVDLSQPVRLEGSWAVQTTGLEILLNGQPTGNATRLTNAPNTFVQFIITNGFVPGVNTLDFVTECVNPPGNNPESAIRVQISSIGYALPPGPPTIVLQPVDQVVRDANYGWGSRAVFEAAAVGRPPLMYQWYAGNAPIPGATNRVLVFENPTAGAQGTSFKVVVSNASGAVTSRVATLTLTTTNTPPTVTNAVIETLIDTAVPINMGELFAACTDRDGDQLSLAYWDPMTTNGVVLTSAENSLVVTYAPPEGYAGYDEFTYTVYDSQGTPATGRVTIRVAAPRVPTNIVARLVGSDFVISGAGGFPNGTFRLLSSTNVALPVAQWAVEATGQFAPDGTFTVTNPVVAEVPQKFYLIAVP